MPWPDKLAGQPPERIVCLSDETTETLYLLGEQKRVVGICGHSVRPATARKEKPRIGGFTSQNLEKILALQPDLVLGFSDLHADIANQLIKRGIQVLVFNQRSVGGILNMIATLGGMVGAARRATQLVTRLAANMERIRRQAEQLPVRPRVYFEEWDNPMICGIQWVSQLIELAGGVDCFADLATQVEAAGRIITSTDEVVDRNPDIILVSWCGKPFQKEVLDERPGWEKIAALRRSQVYEIDSSLILQPGPAALGEGLTYLHEIFTNWQSNTIES